MLLKHLISTPRHASCRTLTELGSNKKQVKTNPVALDLWNKPCSSRSITYMDVTSTSVKCVTRNSVRHTHCLQIEHVLNDTTRHVATSTHLEHATHQDVYLHAGQSKSPVLFFIAAFLKIEHILPPPPSLPALSTVSHTQLSTVSHTQQVSAD